LNIRTARAKQGVRPGLSGGTAQAKDPSLRVLSRFGPKLPRLVEAQLIRQAEPARVVVPRERNPVIWMLAGAGILAAGVWIGTLI
jgi:hypothetical protein